MINKFLFPILTFFIWQNLAYGQTKFEREYRIKSRDVPVKAIAFTAALKFTKKIKWYKEEGLHQTSIEAKTKHNSKKYSVEFNTAGEIEDIEIEIPWEDIPVQTQTRISQYLATAHRKYNIRKIQLQFTGDETTLINTITNKTVEEKATIHYEIVLKARTGKKHQLLEYLFTREGAMVKKAVILLKNTDHLEY